MIKDINIISTIIIACLSIIILVSCESHKKKTNEAFDRFKDAKMISNDSISIYKAMIRELKDAELVKKNENVDEWTKFKVETEKKIVANENSIKKIRSTPNSSSNLLRKVTNIEKANNDLRRQMDEYNEDVKLKWNNFKVKMNHDANEIGIELKDLKTSNKI